MNLRNLELSLNDYAKLANLQMVQDSVDTKAGTHELKKLNNDYNSHLADFEDLRNRFNATQETQHKMQDNSKEYYSQVEHRFKMIDDEINRNLHDTLKKVNQVRDSLRDYQKEVEVRFVDDLNKIQERATYVDLNQLRTDMQIFAPMTAVRELRKEFMPEVRAMKMQIFNFGQENDQMKEMVRRFDEVMSGKASKSSVNELQYNID